METQKIIDKSAHAVANILVNPEKSKNCPDDLTLGELTDNYEKYDCPFTHFDDQAQKIIDKISEEKNSIKSALDAYKNKEDEIEALLGKTKIEDYIN